MTRLTAATVVLIVALAANLASDIALRPVDTVNAGGWDWTATGAFFIWVWALLSWKERR